MGKETSLKIMDEMPIHEWKQAKTRISLMNTAVELMRNKALGNISVEEICRKVEVSKGTFFRYFPRKRDLLFLHVALWGLEAVHHINSISKEASGFIAIESFFEWAAGQIQAHPNLFSEIIALRASEPLEFQKHILGYKKMATKGDCFLYFQNKKYLYSNPDGTIYTILRDNLSIAVAKKEIPESTDFDNAILSLSSIFYGIPIVISGGNELDKLSYFYKTQLKIFWTGLKNTKLK